MKKTLSQFLDKFLLISAWISLFLFIAGLLLNWSDISYLVKMGIDQNFAEAISLALMADGSFLLFSFFILLPLFLLAYGTDFFWRKKFLKNPTGFTRADFTFILRKYWLCHGALAWLLFLVLLAHINNNNLYHLNW